MPSTSEYVAFAEQLSVALGPLYRVSVSSAEGKVSASFGDIDDDYEVANIPLPGAKVSIRIAISQSAVYAAARLAQDLMPGRRQFSVTHLDKALEELISMGETEIGCSVGKMSRLQKRQLVRLLDERGAFTLRKSVETLADLLGVTRITVYNYLDWVRGTGSAADATQ